MPRYKLTIEYDGTPFVGWQIQAAALSVQGVLTEAVSTFAGERVTVSGAGRTDAGVHALGQVAHIDLVEGVGHRHRARCAHRAFAAASGGGGRGRARARTISMHASRRCSGTISISSSIAVADLTLERGRAWRVGKPLDARAMHAAAVRLVGKHDFSTFRDSECQAKSPVKTLDRLDVHRDGDNVSIEASARSFLHSQVRSMVGSLVAVGDGRWSGADLSAALAARDRTACAPVAPPEGLVFGQSGLLKAGLSIVMAGLVPAIHVLR